MKKTLLLFLFCLSVLIAFPQSWQPLAGFPATERDDGVCFTIGNKAYCGTGNEPGFVLDNNFYVLNMDNDTWSGPVAALPVGDERQYAQAFSYGGHGFVMGGIRGPAYFNDLWMYDTLANSWTAQTPLPADGRMGGCAFVINGVAYIVGGRTAARPAISEVWGYDIATGSWTRRNDLPFGARWRASAVSIGNKGYLLFGRDENNRFCNELYEYDAATDTWTQVSAFPLPGRNYAALTSFGSDLIAIAGIDTMNTYHNDMWRYTPSSGSWQMLASIPAQGRKGGMCFGNALSVYYTTGIDSTNTRLEETWKVTNPTGIIENSCMQRISVFPNPAGNEITFLTEELNAAEADIELRDLTGRILRKERASGAIMHLDVSMLGNGFYTLFIHTPKKQYYSKVEVVH